MSLSFYTADTPNGLKVSIYLQEARLPHKQVTVDLAAGEQHQPGYRKINPNGKIPAIVDHDARMTVFESGAILTYLSAKTGCLQPARYADQVRIQQWLHFQVGGIGPMLGQLWWFRHGSRTDNREAIDRYHREALRLYDVVDRRLGESEFIATSAYSIADIAAYSWLRTWEELDLDIMPYVHVQRWLDDINQRPAVRRAIAANGKPMPEQPAPADARKA
ncbi:glutathione S-transferase family protein [Achromobacter aloeverae]|uniref:Glutathione S-transferase n=1 Tax=Achromobacter aloeverae TaxID=1750518 RepID=A0A4Q1HKU2_9BURK|nr:glutathione S-transferase N-terminal domain-containing protein [Achromobacter aloeverae]RXN91037.1 glutathione S-transferase [Achromobacter aloeverae]